MRHIEGLMKQLETRKVASDVASLLAGLLNKEVTPTRLPDSHSDYYDFRIAVSTRDEFIFDKMRAPMLVTYTGPRGANFSIRRDIAEAIASDNAGVPEKLLSALRRLIIDDDEPFVDECS